MVLVRRWERNRGEEGIRRGYMLKEWMCGGGGRGGKEREEDDCLYGRRICYVWNEGEYWRREVGWGEVRKGVIVG